MDKVAPWISGTDVAKTSIPSAKTSIHLDCSSLDKLASRLRRLATKSSLDPAESLSIPLASSEETIRTAVLLIMNEAGIKMRSGTLGENLKVKILKRTGSESGIDFEVRIAAPVYAFKLDEGGAITKPGGRGLLVPYYDRDNPQEAEDAKNEDLGGDDSSHFGTTKMEAAIRRAARRLGVNSELRSYGASTFMLEYGKGGRKGGKKLKVPMIMYRVERKSTTSLMDHAREIKRLRRQGATEEAIAKFREADSSGAVQMTPLFSLRRTVNLKPRPWLASVTELVKGEMNNSMLTALTDRYTKRLEAL